MSYLDKYPRCFGCPVKDFCGTTVSEFKLCNSYKEKQTQQSNEIKQ